MRIHRLTMLFVLAAAIVCCIAPPVSAETGRVVHRGALDSDALTWIHDAQGRSVPLWRGTPLHQQVGAPQIPILSRTLLVPADASAAMVEVVPLKTRTYKAPDELAPGVALLSDDGTAVTQTLFPVEGDVWPSSWNGAGGVSWLRGYRLLSYALFPVRAVRDADGRWTSVEVLEEYEVRLIPLPSVDAATDHVERERMVEGEREALETRLASVVDNPDALAGYARRDGARVEVQDKGFNPSKTPSLGGSPVSNVIITSADMEAEFQVLADHRTATGLPTVVRTVEWIEANYRNGVDESETIRTFIREAYERWGLEYVLLGGDTDVIPARYVRSTFYPPGAYTDIPADLYFACLDGNWNDDGDALFGEPGVSPTNFVDDCDMAAEVAVGRAPVSNASAAAEFVTKLITYDKTPAGSAWANRTLLAAEVLFWTDQGAISLDGAIFAERLYEELFAVHTSMDVTRMYETYAETDTLGNPLYPGSVDLSRQAVIDTLNTGRYGIFDQIGHGFFFNMSLADGNFTVEDADNLYNGGDRPFLMYALNCASAAFDNSCLMERLVQNPDGGSFASIGASRAAFPYTSNDFQYEFFRLLTEDHVDRVGDLMDQSRLPWLALAYSNSFTRWTFFNYTLLGDPAQRIWTDAPAALAMGHDVSIAGGTQSFAVNVTSGGVPVEGAVVTATAGDLFVTGTSDALGDVSLPMTVSDPGSVSLIASGRNMAWTRHVVPVDLGASYVAMTGLAVIDDGTMGSSGNGDGKADAGETVALLPSFTDNGGAGAGPSTATLTGTLTGMTIVTPTASVPAVPAGGSVQATSAFLVDFDSTMADGSFAALGVSVGDGMDVWTTDWDLEVLAPETEPVALEWHDTIYGNSDGVLDSGERVTVLVTLKNYGGGESGQITGRLRTDSGNVTLNDTVVVFNEIPSLSTTNGTGLFSLSVDDVGLPHDAWILFTDADGRTFRHDFSIVVPSVPDGLATDTTGGPDVIGLSWTPVADETLRGYHVYRSLDEAGPFERVTADIIEDISYFRDTGLDLLTRYYYKVSAVDSSLTEGDVSGFIVQSTAPPELTNFPLTFATETSGHLAVGDVTGDGALEIVLGADEVYVWRVDGNEVVDGDGDSQTLGPITDVGGTFGPAGLALADLDGMPGDEIIVVERDARNIYVLRSDGTVLPGWPQHTDDNWAWATPAVGDVDGDGDPEIVLNNLAGQTFVWHVDGTELADGDADPATNGVLIDRAEGQWEWGLSSPALFDIDGDGGCEIIFGTKYGWNNSNKLHAFKDDGTEPVGFPIDVGLGANILSSPAVADVDGDGIWEIAFIDELDVMHLVQQDGTYYPGFPISFTANNSGANCPSPAFGDFDADGELEICAVAVHSATDAYVHVIDTDKSGGSGSLLPGWPQPVAGASESSPVVGDLTGDGMPDILFGVGGVDEETPNNLYGFAHDGSSIDGFPITLGGPVRPSPVITDIDDDLDIDIVYGGWDLLIHVWDLPAQTQGTAMPWPTFGGNNTRDGVYRIVSTTGVEDGVPTPDALTVSSVHPNPFNPSTTVRLYVPGATGSNPHLSVDVYDVLGRRVRGLHAGPMTAGWVDFMWDGRGDDGRIQPSGVYLVRARTARHAVSAKMMLMK